MSVTHEDCTGKVMVMKMGTAKKLGLVPTKRIVAETLLITLVLAAGDTFGGEAQSTSAFSISGKGPHSRVWSKTVQEDVRYKYTMAGFEQDLVFLEAPPAPEQYGLDSATTRMELYTEFTDSPVPVIEDRLIEQETDPLVRKQMVEPDFTDVFLRF